MTRKHYREFASIIRKRREWNLQHRPIDGCNRECHTQELSSVATEISEYFASDNVRFDRKRFMQACGVED